MLARIAELHDTLGVLDRKISFYATEKPAPDPLRPAADTLRPAAGGR